MSSLFACAMKTPCMDTLISAMSHMGAENFELCGLALKDSEKTQLLRVNGNMNELKKNAKEIKSDAFAGLGELKRVHRVKPSGITAPPAVNEDYICALDGKIRDFDRLCLSIDKNFPIATDEDLLLSLLLSFKDREAFDIMSAVGNFTGKASFAFISCADDAVYARAGERPLFVGVSDEGKFISNELFALSTVSDKYFGLKSGEYVKITADKIIIRDEKMKKIKRGYIPFAQARVGESEPIVSPPRAADDTVRRIISAGKSDFPLLKIKKRSFSKIERIILCGTGDSYRASMLGAYYIEAYCDIPCCAKESSELLRSGAVFDKKTLLLAISPNGEDADTVACVKRAKSFESTAICLCRAGTSSLSTLCRGTIEISAGGSPICSYISSALALNLFSLWLGNKNGVISDMYLSVAAKFAELLPGKTAASMKENPIIELVSKIISESGNIFVCGEGADCAIGFQAAETLRGKLNIPACASSCFLLCDINMKIISDSLVIVFLTNRDAVPDVLSCARRFSSLGAKLIIFTTANIENEISGFENVMSFDDSLPVFDGLTALCEFEKAVDLAKNMKSE